MLSDKATFLPKSPRETKVVQPCARGGGASSLWGNTTFPVTPHFFRNSIDDTLPAFSKCFFKFCSLPFTCSQSKVLIQWPRTLYHQGAGNMDQGPRVPEQGSSSRRPEGKDAHPRQGLRGKGSATLGTRLKVITQTELLKIKDITLNIFSSFCIWRCLIFVFITTIAFCFFPVFYPFY